MRKQRFSVPLVGGLDTKRSDETIIQGKLVQADNVVFSDSDTLEVRAGLTDIAYSPADAARLWVHDGKLCVDGNRLVDGTVNGIDPQSTSYRTRYLPQISATGITIARGPWASNVQYDFASNGTLYVTVANVLGVQHNSVGAASRYGLSLSICNSDGQLLDYKIIPYVAGLTGAIVQPRVVINANGIFVFASYDIGGTIHLYCHKYLLTAPYDADGTVDLGVMGTGYDFDVVSASTPATAGALVVGWQQAANNMRFLSLNTTTGTILATDNVALAAGSNVTYLNLGMGLSGGTYRFFAFYVDANVGVNDLSGCISGITGNGTALAYGAGVAGATRLTSAATSIHTLCLVEGSTYMNCVFTGTNANGALSIYSAYSISHTTLAVAGEAILVHGLGLASKLTTVTADSDVRGVFFRQSSATARNYCFVAQLRALTSTAAFATNMAVQGIINPDNSAPYYSTKILITTPRLPGVYASATETSTAVVKYGDLFIRTGVLATPESVELVRLTTTGQLGHVPLDAATLLPSGAPAIATSGIYEASFHYAPEITALTTGAGTHLTALATYSFVATYMALEPNGDITMSAPSAPWSMTIGGAAQNGTFTVTTEGIARRPNIRICLWRLIGGNYYLENIADNDQLARTVTIATAFTDAQVISNEPLYTNGGVLSNQPLPACRAGCAWADRIFVTDGLRIHFTHKKEVNFGYEYAITNQIAVPSDWGRVVGLAGMDDKLVIFGEKKIGYLYGDGPTRAGTGDFSRPIAIVHNLGARWGTHKGIVVVDEGVWFQSPRGLRLLTRGMSIARREDGVEFGSEVDDLNPGVATKPYSQTTVVNVVAACVLPSKPEVRFYMDNGTCLVLNRDWNQWSKFTNHTTTDAVAADKFYHIHDASTIRYYDEGSATTTQQPVGDGAARTEFPVTLKTGKLSLAGIQGFARIYEAGWTVATDDAFTAASPVSFTLTATTDEGNSTAQAYTLSSQGSVEHFFALQPAYQKCSWIQMTMAFDPNSTGSTAASRFLGRIRFVNLTLLLGLKPGLSKQNRVKY